MTYFIFCYHMLKETESQNARKAHVKESSQMRALSAVWQCTATHRKNQGREKTPVKYCARTTVQYPERREHTVGAIENVRSLRSEMPLTLIPAGLLEALSGRDTEHQNDLMAFPKSCLKHFVAISPASVLDSVTSGRAEQCAAVCKHPGTTV